MSDTIRDTWVGFLHVLESIVIPDWGALIALIPLALLGLVLLGMGVLARLWLAYYIAAPITPRARPRTPAPLRTEILRRAALIPIGAFLVGLALTVLPRRVGAIPQVGPDLVVLLAGIIIALAGVGLAVLAAESADRRAGRQPSHAPGPTLRLALRSVAARIDRMPRWIRPLLGIVLGALIVAAAFLAAGGPPAAGVLPEVALQPVLVGILLALGSVAAAVRAWERDERA